MTITHSIFQSCSGEEDSPKSKEKGQQEKKEAQNEGRKDEGDPRN